MWGAWETRVAEDFDCIRLIVLLQGRENRSGMKLHLPVSLLRILVLLAGMSTAQAAIRHSDVSLNTYVDFATNAGRYATGTTNALLEHIRQREGGVCIEYTGGQAAQTLPHGMISFDSVPDLGNGTLVGYNYLVTVAHNQVLNPAFGGNVPGIGSTHSPSYKGIEEIGAKGTFVHRPAGADYKLTRLSRLVTDAVPAPMYCPPYIDGRTDMKGALVYRVGGGDQLVKDYAGKNTTVSYAGIYTVAGVGCISEWADSTRVGSPADIKSARVTGKSSWGRDGVGSATPLPFGSTPGDSGSPYFVWDAAAGRFALLMAHTGSFGNGELMAAQAAPLWTLDTMESHNVRVDMGTVKGALCINGAKACEDKGGVEDIVNGTTFSVSPARGFLSHEGGNLYDKDWNAVAFNGVETSTPMWKSLSPLRNTPNWYAYGSEYLNACDSVTVVDKEVQVNPGLTYAGLFLTQNLVLEAAADKAAYTINVSADTDLGAGYVHFAAEKVGGVQFVLKSDTGKRLDSAGYVVDAGVQVDVSLRNADAAYMREWRKVGGGALNICGNGNNEVFLNVGGKGTTLLNQEKGYAAWNVLVNTGSSVVIASPEQIGRDLTFGNGGGVLDLHGNSMDWWLSGGESRPGFSINALTEAAVVSNRKGAAELRFMEPGKQKYAGSFRDAADASLRIVYAGGGIWELNGIRTSLTNAASGLTVQNGTVKLAGTPTVHGFGSSSTLSSADFSTREHDWHYADAAMNVRVEKGATFELGSHARLSGTVSVEPGGCYVMHPGVHAEKEYIEGGERLESTADIADFFGHKGSVKLSAGGTLQLLPGTRAQLCSLELAAGSLVNVTDASLAVEQLTLAVDTAFRRKVKLAYYLRLTGADGRTFRPKRGAGLEFCADVVQGGLQLDCRKLTVDFRGVKQLPGGLVRVRLGEVVRLSNPETMRIEALTPTGTVPGYYHPAAPDLIYFLLP